MSKKLEPCADCSGITYRQTTSGKIIPASHICPSKITPPCYQPDGDGCAYQTYGDGGEPIDKCKECPHCYTDKERHKANEALMPCDVCRFNPPSSCDGKPCCMCPAEGRPPEGLTQPAPEEE